MPRLTYRVWMNSDETVMIRWWEDGTVQVCQRWDRDASWEAPVLMRELGPPPPRPFDLWAVPRKAARWFFGWAFQRPRPW